MNRIYKVIWNEALSCFTAVGEYAKGRGKSSKSSVSSNATINTTSNLSVIRTIRLSTIALGLLAAGFGMQANALGTYFAGDDPTPRIHTNSFLHQTLTVQGGETVIGDPNTKNISVTANRHDKSLTIKLDENIDLGTDGSLKTGDTLVDNSGIKITAINPANSVTLSSSGLNNGNNKIINVADGDVMVGSKDAVNGSQLHSLASTVAANKTKYYSVNSSATGLLTNENNDGATGYNAMAMGGNASASGSQTIAIGSGESGQHTTASGEQSIAIGANVVSKGSSSIAIGGDDLNAASEANTDGTANVGQNSGSVNTVFRSYTGRDLVEPTQYDRNTEAAGAASIAIGSKALSTGDLSTAIGVQSSTAGIAASAFGIGASASKDGSVSLGAGAQSNTQDGVALGSQSVANVAGGALGFAPSSASVIDKAAITATNSTGLGAVSVGSSTNGTRQIVNVAAGTQNSDAVNVSQLKALDTIVAGIDFPIRSGSAQPYTTSVTGTDALAVGSNANAKGNNATAVGESAFANANATVIGEGARSSFNGFAGGQEAKAGVNSVAIGQRATNGTASRAVAIGYEAKATAQDTIALGLDARAEALGSIALGKGSRANALNSVALGQNSIAAVQSGASFLTNVAADANNGTVSVGAVASERRIVNVAGGSADTDAVNVSQLKAVTDIANRGWDISAQGDATTASTVGPGDSVDFNSKNSNITVSKDTTSNDVSFELNNNLDLGNNGSVRMGSSSPFDFGDTTTLDRSGLKTGNSYFSTTVDGLGVRTGNRFVNTNVSSLGVAVSTPFSKTLLSSNGLNIIGGPSVTKSGGINAANRKVVNVDDGTQAKDAVNVSQLSSASAAAKTEVAAGTNIAGVVKSTGGNGQDVYTVNADGVTASAGSAAVTVTAGEKDDTTNTTDYAVDLSADSKASLVKADSAMQTIVAQIDGVDVKTLNQTDNTANFLTGDNIVLNAEDGGIKIATKEDVTFTSASFADSTVRVNSEGLDNGGNRIVNVDDGQGDTDAVNVRQLNATNNTVDLGLNFTGDDTTVVVNRKLGQTLTLQGGATELTENNIGVIADEEGNLNVRLAEDVMLGKNGSVRMESTVLNNAGVTIADGPNQTITLSNEGLDNGNNRIIKVDKGIAPTDAVNFAQLTMTNDEIAKGIKIGDGNSANDQQFSLGDTINVTGDNNLTTVASATGVQVKLNNQLDLGDNGSIQIGNSIMSDAGFTFVGNGVNRMVSQVSLSSRGLDNGGNTIRNVGEGVLNTDAVNVGQLKDVAIALDQGWGITAQGDIATMVKQGDAVDLSSKDGNIKVSRKSVSDVAALNGSPSLQAVAIPTSANDISFDLNPDITLNSVTTGGTVMNDNGLTIAGGPSITKSGIDAANTKITNVQNGEVSATSQDAINGGQLYAQGTGISSIIGGDTVYDAESGTFTNSDIGGTGESNIDGAIASIRQGTIEISENVQINTESITTNTTNIATNTTNIATNTSNITTNTTNIKTNTDKLDAGLNFGADSGANINKPIGDGSVLSFTGGNNITTTADGSSIKFDLNGNISVDSVTVGTTIINSEGISMQDGPSMTSQGLYAGNQRMTGVAEGVEATDAVNYSQLSALDSRLNNNMSDLGYKIDEVEDDANAGISAAMAMSAMPQAYIAGKSLIGGGVGTYNGESAVAIGFSKLSNDGRWVIKVNGSADTQGNVGGAVGAGFHFD